MKKALSIVAAGMLVLLGSSRPSTILYTWPRELWVPTRRGVVVPWSRWLPLQAYSSDPRLKVDRRIPLTHPAWTLEADAAGRYRLNFRLFGWLPWGSTWVKASSPLFVVPGGQSIGILVHTRGLIIRALSPVASEHGRLKDPAAMAGIRPGDLLTAADHRRLDSVGELAHIIEAAGSHHHEVALTVVGTRRQELAVRPIWSPQRHTYALGITVQDGAAGVGTLTYWRPGSRQFAALGHSLTDGLTIIPAPVTQGRVVGADIVGILAASGNRPGQKIGILAHHSNLRGWVTANGRFGVRGHLTRVPRQHFGTIPVALPDEVHHGPAQLMTVLRGATVQSYRIRIVKAYPQGQPATKGILFQVTDPRLLRKAGGIVQGMSGSPLLQDGRLVGAVTHVLVGRSNFGYACYAIWMMDQHAHQGGS